MLLRRLKRILSVSTGIFVTILVFATGTSANPLGPLKTEFLSQAVRPLAEKVQLRPQGVRRRLRNKGYSKISIIDRRPPGFTIKACKNGNRFLLHMHRRGRIVERRKIGRCGVKSGRKGLSPPQVRKDLRDRGFEEIRFLDRDLPTYVATACKRGKRYRLRMDRWAKVSKKTLLGMCGGAFLEHKAKKRIRRKVEKIIPKIHRVDGKRPPQIRKLLQNRGFDRITFLDRRLPTYVVRACKNGRRMELRIDGAGWIRGRQRLGRCKTVKAGMNPPQVRKVLRTRGFSRIKFLDRQLPSYVVEACRHGRKFKIRLDRFARVVRKRNIGSCRVERAQSGYGPREVSDILHRRGYREIDFFDRRLPGYGVNACRRGQKFRMRINRFAEIKFRRRTGFCRPPISAPPVVVNDYDDVDEEEIDGTEEINPETCQTYLDALVRRNRIHFDVASAALRRGSYGLLTRLARVMDRCPASRIEISGHTDSDGSNYYNRDLSRRRAKTVAGFLAQEGISLRRMTAYGYGEEQPLMRYERTERDKARNRRIEFTVIWGDDDDDRDDMRYR